jgi:hypothetical protein
MSKNFQEPEEMDMDFQNEEILDDFNPLDEAVIEKEYTKPNVTINPKDFESDIPEPSLTPPPMMGMGGSLNEEDKKKKVEPREPINKEYNQMSSKDKNDASERLVEMCITGYKALNTFVDSRIQFDEKKLNKMAIEGEIDMNMEVPISQTDSVTLQEFVREYNDQSKGTISVSKEFEDEIRPPLKRIFAKRGVGMTDEQYVGYVLIKDIIAKGFIVRQSMSVKKEYLEMFKEQTMLLRQGAQMPQAPTPPPPQQTYTPPPTTPPPTESYVSSHNPDTNVNDFVNQMTGAYVPPQMSEPIYDEPTMDESSYEMPQEEKPKITIIDEGGKKGKRGRPKKK